MLFENDLCCIKGFGNHNRQLVMSLLVEKKGLVMLLFVEKRACFIIAGGRKKFDVSSVVKQNVIIILSLVDSKLISRRPFQQNYQISKHN